MNARNDTLLILALGGMEMSWRYAWVLFLSQLAIHERFSFAVAAGAFCLAASLTHFSAGRNWRIYQKLLLQLTGFLSLAFWAVHSTHYQAFPFWSPGWVSDLFVGAKSLSQGSILFLTLLFLWLIWRGGQVLVRSSRRYFPVCMHFDKGLGLLLLLLIVKAFVQSRFGFFLQDPAVGFLAVAHFVFSLTAIGIARNQGNVQKSFLSGYHGIGIILSVSTMVTLFIAGSAFLVYPYLSNLADSTLIVLKDIAQPMTPVLIKILRVLFGPRKLSLMPDESPVDSPTLPDVGPQTVEGWEALSQLAVAGIIGLVLLGALGCLLFFIIRFLFKKDRENISQPAITEWILDKLRMLAALPLHVWRGLVSLLKGVDCAATAYARMLHWGRRSGVASIPSETPAEYGNRLMSGFPGLGAEIAMIVDAFNREVYGHISIDRLLLSRLRWAQRRMERLRHWPLRIKGWFLQ